MRMLLNRAESIWDQSAVFTMTLKRTHGFHVEETKKRRNEAAVRICRRRPCGRPQAVQELQIQTAHDRGLLVCAVLARPDARSAWRQMPLLRARLAHWRQPGLLSSSLRRQADRG